MSRNFEDDYRNEMLSQVPDLWDRIERSLPDKRVSSMEETPANDEKEIRKSQETNRGKETTEEKGSNSFKDTEPGKESRIIKFPNSGVIKFAAGFAACLLLVCIAVPAWNMLKGGAMHSNESAAPTEDMQMADGGEAAAEAAAEETAKDSYFDVANAVAEEDVVTDKESEEAPAGAEEGVDMTIHEEIPIRVKSVRQVNDDTIYTVDVSKPEVFDFLKSSEIEARITDASLGKLAVDTDYVVSLQLDLSAVTSGDKPLYVIVKIDK